MKDTFRKEKADELYADYERFERISRGGNSMASLVSLSTLRVVRSTLCAGTIAMASAAEAAMFYHSLFHEFLGFAFQYIVLQSANFSLTCYILHVVNDKRFRFEITDPRSLVDNTIIKELKWVTTNCQLADPLTKVSNKACEKLRLELVNQLLIRVTSYVFLLSICNHTRTKNVSNHQSL